MFCISGRSSWTTTKQCHCLSGYGKHFTWQSSESPGADTLGNSLSKYCKRCRQSKLGNSSAEIAGHSGRYKVNKYKEAAGEMHFRNLSQLALSLYSLPYSNAEVERIFSKMNYFKNKTRNRMSSATLDALIQIEGGLHWREEECHNFTVTNKMKSKFNTATIYQTIFCPTLMMNKLWLA